MDCALQANEHPAVLTMRKALQLRSCCVSIASTTSRTTCRGPQP